MARSLVCTPNALAVYDYLVGRGLRDFQAAAVVGNLQGESRINPQLSALDTNGLMSRGIAMWQPPRWQNLLSFAAGRDPLALTTQIDFLWHELQTDSSLGLSALVASSDVDSATVVFQNQFEKPKQSLAHTSDRIAFAREALNCFSIRPPSPAPASSNAVKGLVAAGLGATIVGAAYAAYRVFALRPPKRPPQPIVPAPSPPRIRRFSPAPPPPFAPARGRIP